MTVGTALLGGIAPGRHARRPSAAARSPAAAASVVAAAAAAAGPVYAAAPTTIRPPAGGVPPLPCRRASGLPAGRAGRQLRLQAAAGGALILESVKMPVPPPPHPTFDIEGLIRTALEEDAGGVGDITTLSTIPEARQGTATFLAKATGTLAGVAVAEMVCRVVDPALEVEWTLHDGDRVAEGDRFGTIRGSARSILVAERICLNFMQRMSGIATATAAMVAEASVGGPSVILETRKTVPGLRLLDKWAVVIGGGRNHRMGLYDMVMIKDNHIAAAGGLSAAVAACGDYLSSRGMAMDVEVEAATLAQVEEVLGILDGMPAGAVGRPTRIMLDNMCVRDPAQEGGVDVSLMAEAVALIAGRVETEASGNVTLETVRKISSTGVTFISSGALTHSVEALDISLGVVI